MWLVALLSCSPIEDRAVYRSGPNAIARFYPGSATELRLWGPEGTVKRVPSDAPNGFVLLGQSGPLWILEDSTPDLPAITKAPPVTAALVERAGFRMRELFAPGAASSASTQTTSIEPDRSAGVTLRSVVKVRRKLAPPVYVAVATRGAHGIPKPDGTRSPVTAATDCEAMLAVIDDDMGKTLYSLPISEAATTCGVPVVTGAVDYNGDDYPDVYVHGQMENKGFGRWYAVWSDGTLKAGAGYSATDIP